MLTLVLTRHGRTARSEPEQHLGQRIDIGLSSDGVEAARALAVRLEGVEFGRVVSSPLARARETAAIVAPEATVETDARLLEMDYGSWEGLTYEQIEERDGPARRLWEMDPAGLACPGGESGEDVARRTRAFLEEAVEWSESVPGRPADDRRLLVVAHSTTNRILLCVALGVPVRDYRKRFRQEPANLTVLRFAGPRGSGAQLLLANDMAHVRGTRGATWD